MRVKIKYLILTLALLVASSAPQIKAEAISCPDLRIVFARGSGGERWTTDDYLVLKSTSLSYEFIDLDYPAVGVGWKNLGVTIGAYFGSGDSYEFGDSVNDGVKNLISMVNGSSCPNTKYVLGGYSQGAMVVSKSLESLKSERLIYAATFGDPKIYLPEGKGLLPEACRGGKLSDYRMYVPDCQAYKGLLGAYMPYEPESLVGKVGTWCNKMDVFCSSKFDLDDHLEYIEDELYTDASKVIFDKITKAFNLENHITSPHDTVTILDSTGSMSYMIEEYKAEAIRLATKTFESGGRVALYDYRDLDDPYTPVEHCNFENCTMEVIQQKIDEIEVDGGGDANESLLSASFSAMKSLKWKFGATKSIVVLTDAPFLMPDRDGVTMDDVVKLSKEIDPVNYYIITNEESAESYEELAERTDGMVVTDFNKLDLLTDYIIERYDSLPRVEESIEIELPTLEIKDVIDRPDAEVQINFESSSEQTIVILNDEILGITNEKNIIISDLNPDKKNVLSLVPISNGVRGDGVSVDLRVSTMVIPKAPNTGKK